ncbi:MAG TPA: histidine phosphatase family protein [Burkholderiaceae bacterium]|jgi:probable phosphoglycerate mutase
MTDLLLIRHGETAWNAEKRLQGHLDVALNDIGLHQAQLLAQALHGERIDAIFSSDLMRARQTAAPIAAAQGLDLGIESELRERCYGAFEGLRYPEMNARYPDAYVAMQARQLDYRFPPGENVAETLGEFSARSLAIVTRLLRSSNYRKLAIVTHGGVLDCLNRFARGADMSRPRDFDIPNAGINRLQWDGSNLKIVQWADVGHLNIDALDEI